MFPRRPEDREGATERRRTAVTHPRHLSPLTIRSPTRPPCDCFGADLVAQHEPPEPLPCPGPGHGVDPLPAPFGRQRREPGERHPGKAGRRPPRPLRPAEMQTSPRWRERESWCAPPSSLRRRRVLGELHGGSDVHKLATVPTILDAKGHQVDPARLRSPDAALVRNRDRFPVRKGGCR